jgi:DNA-binding IclR family transcriptional regulator
MKKLSKSIDKDDVLCVMENTYIMNITFIEKEDSNLFLVKIGRELPLFSTSAGRVFCAFMDREKVRSVYESVHEQAPHLTQKQIGMHYVRRWIG